VIYALKERLHTPPYAQHSSLPLNFEVRLFRSKRGGGGHSGQGALTLPTPSVGEQFLREFSSVGIVVRGRRIQFLPSRNHPRPETVEKINRMPYIDPHALEKQEARTRQLQKDLPSVETIQFGWHCRDGTFSIEWERTCSHGCRIYHDADQRLFRVKIFDAFTDTRVIAIRFSQIGWCAASTLSSNEAALTFNLWESPVFESEPSDLAIQIAELYRALSVVPRKRLSALDEHHEPYVPYTRLAMRLVCSSQQDISTFEENCRTAGMQVPRSQDVDVGRHGLFSLNMQGELESWLKDLPWNIAYQVTLLVKCLVLDIPEMLGLKERIRSYIERTGEEYTSSLLHYFGASEGFYENGEESVEECFDRSAREHDLQFRSHLEDSENLFYCQHAFVTPTTILLEGPYPERSNRVIRQYAGYHDRFLRVSFVEEGRLQYRFDRDVDGADFVRHRVGKFLKSRLQIAGRTFQFLAYSNSALREHAVWFVSPFDHPQFGHVNAQSIIIGIGSFDNVTWDRKLMYCPARYGARISQAFTATDASVSVEAEEILRMDDIERDGSCFTDGVGTISRDLAKEIWKRLPKRPRTYPSAFQVRFGGSKGMLSVDHKLSGRAICLRYSMIKFEAPQSRNIEIAKAFDKPGKYYLNRPLIMLLEGLGVPYEVFQKYQDNAVKDAQVAFQSFSATATLLESYGLGASFRLPSILQSLHKLNVAVPEDPSYEQMITFAMHHILRELKHHARILVPGGWTLVGVADVHCFLQAGEIFACVQEYEHDEKIYLEGQFLISRSPTIHPGDVQKVRAIGRPPQGSCFEKETLTNTVVFSVLGLFSFRSSAIIHHLMLNTTGNQSLPSMLGGGDLDGDVYNLIPLEKLPISAAQA
jgi:RNA-dependent RNA polymerase